MERLKDTEREGGQEGWSRADWRLAGCGFLYSFLGAVAAVGLAQFFDLPHPALLPVALAGSALTVSWGWVARYSRFSAMPSGR